MSIGHFERRARERKLREALWRSVWIQAHVYERKTVPGLGESLRDRVFMQAVEDQTRLVQDEAEALGLRGDPAWCRGRP